MEAHGRPGYAHEDVAGVDVGAPAPPSAAAEPVARARVSTVSGPATAKATSSADAQECVYAATPMTATPAAQPVAVTVTVVLGPETTKLVRRTKIVEWYAAHTYVVLYAAYHSSHSCGIVRRVVCGAYICGRDAKGGAYGGVSARDGNCCRRASHDDHGAVDVRRRRTAFTRGKGESQGGPATDCQRRRLPTRPLRSARRTPAP